MPILSKNIQAGLINKVQVYTHYNHLCLLLHLMEQQYLLHPM
jgi:hypothetical protein